MQQKSLGLIETQGLAAGVEAADAAVKSANVELVGYELTKGGGWTTIKIQGDVGAVKAAVDAARMAAAKVNRVVSTRVIARPSEGLKMLIHSSDTVGDEQPEPPKGPEAPPPANDPEPPENPVTPSTPEDPAQTPEPGMVPEEPQEIESAKPEQVLEELQEVNIPEPVQVLEDTQEVEIPEPVQVLEKLQETETTEPEQVPEESREPEISEPEQAPEDMQNPDEPVLPETPYLPENHPQISKKQGVKRSGRSRQKQVKPPDSPAK